MLVSILRYIKGYVRFQATGNSPERLLNLAAARGVSLWEPQPEEGGLSAFMSARDYRAIRPLTKRARVRTKVTSKRGLPFIFQKCRGRAGLFAGAAAGAILLIVLSQFLWSYEIVGANHVSEQAIRDVLAQNGVVQGVPKASLDVEQAERACLRRLDTLSWMSVNIQGCTACVEVREKDKKPEIQSLQPANIKASRDGVITDIRARQGFTQVQKGSGVVKGQLLVSGVNPTRQGGMRFVRADADIMAEYTEQKSLELPRQFDYYSLSENKIDRKRLKCFWLEFPVSLSFGGFDHTAYTFREEVLQIGSKTVPLSVRTETACELLEGAVTLSKAQAERVFLRHLLLTELFCQPKTQVIGRHVMVKETKGGYSCTAICTNCENIAQTSEFSVTE